MSVVLKYWIHKTRYSKRFAYNDLNHDNAFALVRPTIDGFSWYVLDEQRKHIVKKGHAPTFRDAIECADDQLVIQGYIILGPKFSIMC